MEATGDIEASVGMTIRVLKSELIPLLAGFVVCDLFVTIGWIGMVIKGMLPVKKWMIICCPGFYLYIWKSGENMAVSAICSFMSYEN